MCIRWWSQMSCLFCWAWHIKFQIMNFYAYNFLKENTFIQLDIYSYIFLTSVRCAEILKQRNSLCKLTLFKLTYFEWISSLCMHACQSGKNRWLARSLVWLNSDSRHAQIRALAIQYLKRVTKGVIRNCLSLTNVVLIHIFE
jgi:hypothetical protein